MQRYMPRQQKTIHGASPQHLPAIDIRAARMLNPFQRPSTVLPNFSSSPRSQSRSSSFSNKSFASAQEESTYYTPSSSGHSSKASLPYHSPPSSLPDWQDSYCPHRPSLNPIIPAGPPPKTDVDELIERLSRQNVSTKDLLTLQKIVYRNHLAAPLFARNVVPATSTASVDTSTVYPAKAPIKKELYKTELCRSWEEQGQCRYGLKCLYAHGPQELRNVQRHPKYKTELCHSFIETGSCPYGKRCVFVHSTSLLDDVEKPLKKNDSRKTPLQSRVGGSNGPSWSEHRPMGVEVQDHSVTSSHLPRKTLNETALAEKWGREMANFPSNWLNNSIIDCSGMMASKDGANIASLQASVRSLII